LGNIQETPLADLVNSPAQLAFGAAKEQTLPRYCRTCEVRGLCNGGCPKDRFIRTPDGQPGLNYLCAGFKRFFNYSLPYLQLLAALHKDGQPPERLMQLVQAMNREPFAGTCRNDPCPCGSGRKYKKCCLSKRTR
jgi:uncharacterized protein